MAGCSLAAVLWLSLAGQAATSQDDQALPTFELASIRMRPPGEQLSIDNIPRVCQIGSVHQMMQALLRDRFKLVLRSEQREENVFVLTRVRTDRLGPGLRPASASCAADGAGFLRNDKGQQCWGPVVDGHLAVTGHPMRDFIRQLETFLENSVVRPSGSPDLSTALREQLGLRLSQERTAVTRFVLDRAEMPTAN